MQIKKRVEIIHTPPPKWPEFLRLQKDAVSVFFCTPDLNFGFFDLGRIAMNFAPGFLETTVPKNQNSLVLAFF